MLAAIAKELGVTRGAVAKWSRIPAGRVIAVERVTGISREELRPDPRHGGGIVRLRASEPLRPEGERGSADRGLS